VAWAITRCRSSSWRDRQYEEMRYFHVINTRHKGVPTDVVDRHLLSMREAEGIG